MASKDQWNDAQIDTFAIRDEKKIQRQWVQTWRRLERRFIFLLPRIRHGYIIIIIVTGTMVTRPCHGGLWFDIGL